MNPTLQSFDQHASARNTVAAYFFPRQCHFLRTGLNSKEAAMKSNLKISLVAGLLLAAGLAYSQGPMGGGQCDLMMMGQGMQGQGMGPRGMGRMDPAKMQAMQDQRHAALKAQLKLTAAQEPAWTAFTAAAKPHGAMQAKQLDPAEMAKLTTPERIEKMKTMRAQRMGEMASAMDKHAEATNALYAVLTPEQQKIFDANAMQGQRPQGTRSPAKQAKP